MGRFIVQLKLHAIRAGRGKCIDLEFGDPTASSKISMHTPLARELLPLYEGVSVFDIAEVPWDRWPGICFTLELTDTLPMPNATAEMQQQMPIPLHLQQLVEKPHRRVQLISLGTVGTVSLMYYPVIELNFQPEPELYEELCRLPLQGGVMLIGMELM